MLSLVAAVPSTVHIYTFLIAYLLAIYFASYLQWDTLSLGLKFGQQLLTSLA